MPPQELAKTSQVILGGVKRGSIDTFSTPSEALAISLPVTKSHIKHWHSPDSCFGMRIMRPRAKDGTVARRWLARYYERGRDFRINLGAADRIAFDQARVAALTHRPDAHSHRERGIVLAATFTGDSTAVAAIRFPLSLFAPCGGPPAPSFSACAMTRRVASFDRRRLAVVPPLCDLPGAPQLNGEAKPFGRGQIVSRSGISRPPVAARSTRRKMNRQTLSGIRERSCLRAPGPPSVPSCKY